MKAVVTTGPWKAARPYHVIVVNDRGIEVDILDLHRTKEEADERAEKYNQKR